MKFFGFSWTGYRKVRKGAKKRVARHMQELGCRQVAAYLGLLAADPALRDACEKRLAVSISRFFRDRRLWETLEAELPGIFLSRPCGIPCKVWSAGCARGEEPYSFKILWSLLASRHPGLPALVILATDLHPENLEAARRGIYPAGSIKEMNALQRAEGLTPLRGGRQWAVRPEIKQDIFWQEHNLRSAPPGGPYDLILLRNNILTYFDDPLKSEAFAKVIGALAPAGLLVIGTHEKLPPGYEAFRAFSGYRHAFWAPGVPSIS